MAADLRAVDPARTVDLDAAQPVIVVGDEARLRQVAANLVSNVRRYTPPGTPARGEPSLPAPWPPGTG